MAGDDLVRRLNWRYVLLLASVVGLVVADQAVIQPLLARMNGYAPIINVAGRQRMLSQKLAKAALGLHSSQSPSTRAIWRAEVRESVRAWTAAHQALRGNAERGMLRLSSPEIDYVWTALEPHFAAMRHAAEELGNANADAETETAAVDTIVFHEPLFLGTMDRLVSLMEAEADTELRWLRGLALLIAGTIITLVAALGWFVIRPATRAIRGEVDRLETQVALRTRKLDETVVELCAEIAERQTMEARNQALAAQLAHANRVESVGHLAAGLAHELNHPFATIVNYTEACTLALGQPLDDGNHKRLQDFIERVRVASLRAGNIVRRIRNFVRPGPSEMMTVEVVALVQEVVELCRGEAHRAEARLAFEPSVAAGILVEADPIQIQQVLINLIQNAVQAVEHGPSQDRHIGLRVKALAETVQIDVVDNGPGFAGVDADSLFTPFHSTKADGLGIGLSICRSIVEQHRGTIWAQSLSPHGARFSFVLPQISSHAPLHARQADGVCH